jgi:hypothetical protein
VGSGREFDDLALNAPFAQVEGRGRRSFRARLEPVEGLRIRVVGVVATPYDPPYSRSTQPAIVRVRG